MSIEQRAEAGISELRLHRLASREPFVMVTVEVLEGMESLLRDLLFAYRRRRYLANDYKSDFVETERKLARAVGALREIAAFLPTRNAFGNTLLSIARRALADIEVKGDEASEYRAGFYGSRDDE